jgi:signal transduction histidine kinase/ActR/RegA family two-component response regulator
VTRVLAWLRGVRMPRLSIRHILLFTTAGLAIMLAVLMARDLAGGAARLQRVHALRDALAMSDYLFDATAKVSVERDLALASLNAADADVAAELAPRLAESRRHTDESVRLALEQLQQFDLPALEHLRRSLEARHRVIQMLRENVDGEIATPRIRRNATMATRWERSTDALMSDTETLWIQFIRPFTTFDATVTQHLRYRHFLRTITVYTGKERSTIGQILSDGREPTAEQVTELLQGEGVLAVSWTTSKLLAEQTGLFSAIETQFTDAESHYATLHDMLRELFYVPGAAQGGAYPIGPDLWFELSEQAAESLAILRDASRDAMNANMDRMIAQTERDMLGQALVLALALGLSVLSLWLVIARVIRPIDRIIDALTRATRGEHVTFTADPAHADEIEKLTSVLGAFQVKAEEVRQTADQLDQSVRSLEKEVVVRRAAEEKAQAQLERLALLHQISRAIGERQDTASIYDVAIRSVEQQLPADFACVALYDPADHVIEIVNVGAKAARFTLRAGMNGGARIDVGENGLSRCVRGALVYEPDVAALNFAFPQRLAISGLRSFVGAPLQVESQVFGVLMVARVEANAFESGECEFLRQLSEHVALAMHQAQLNTALRRAYEDLRQTQDAVMQQERLRSLGQMASGIAHDINNALSPVALYTESLLGTEPNLTAAGRNKLEIIQRAIDDAALTIARMSELYRRRDVQMTLTPVNIEELLEQVLALTQARWRDMPQERGNVIEMRTEFEDGAPPILGVESELREALTNLVFNAVDAMPNGGTITLRSRVAGDDKVAIEVADTGAGMDDETRRRCLEPFFTTKGERGTGLGLAMVYGVVQRHGGDLEIDSTPGLGTSMRMVFTAASEGAQRSAATAAHLPLRRLRILLVDDDPIVLRSLRDVLEADGHVVSTADGGEAGIAAFGAAMTGNAVFDAVITDLGMPRVDGRRVALAIKQVSNATPVILLTGWGERLKAEEEMPPHVDYMLSKPAKLADLRAALSVCPASSLEAKLA